MIWLVYFSERISRNLGWKSWFYWILQATNKAIGEECKPRVLFVFNLSLFYSVKLSCPILSLFLTCSTSSVLPLKIVDKNCLMHVFDAHMFQMASERQKILKDSKSILPVSFVSFNSRWGAAVCAQTQQSKNPTLWLTNWAPEPRDIYWRNLAIPFVSLTVRKLIISLSVFALVFFYMIPIAFVQSLANLEGLEKVAPFLRPVIEL